MIPRGVDFTSAEQLRKAVYLYRDNIDDLRQLRRAARLLAISDYPDAKEGERIAFEAAREIKRLEGSATEHDAE